ncbi:MAG: hypothetical protein ACR2OJ_14095 [Hyphomicrobiales bacterium]
MLHRLLSPLTALLLFCASAAHASPPPAYTCDVIADDALTFNGTQLGGSIYYGGKLVALSAYPDGPAQTLERASNPAGELYENDKLRFYVNGDTGVLIVKNGSVYPCRKADPTYAPIAEGTFPASGASLGGKVRKSADITSQHVFSLAELAPISLLERQDKIWNGSPWFRIRTEDGRTGFQWGGIICSNNELIPGVYKTCKDARKEMGK